jgi:hypothetical protein
VVAEFALLIFVVSQHPVKVAVKPGLEIGGVEGCVGQSSKVAHQ